MFQTSHVQSPLPPGVVCTLTYTAAKKLLGRKRDPGPLWMTEVVNPCVVERAGVWPEGLRKDNGDPRGRPTLWKGLVRAGPVAVGHG